MTISVAQLRRSRNVPATDLAETLGITPDLLNHFERGRRRWPVEMENTAREWLLAQPEEPYVLPRHRHYLACVRDTATGIVLLHFQTSVKRKVPSLVHDYYIMQGWEAETIKAIDVFPLGPSGRGTFHVGTMHL